jgi:hypothetical protein
MSAIIIAARIAVPDRTRSMSDVVQHFTPLAVNV